MIYHIKNNFIRYKYKQKQNKNLTDTIKNGKELTG